MKGNRFEKKWRAIETKERNGKSVFHIYPTRE